MEITATSLRTRLYRVLDEVADSGVPVDIVRKGKRLRIQVAEPEPRGFSFDALESGPLRAIDLGAPEALPYVDFTETWDPDSSLP